MRLGAPMPLFPTPGQFSSRALLYQQLSQLTAAGLTLQGAVELQRRSPPSRSLRRALELVLAELRRGATFADALESAARWVSPFDRALLRAGEHSGRLPACFSLLAAHYENSASLLRQVLNGLLYPAFLFHLSILLAPLPQLVLTGNLGAYLGAVLAILVPVHAVVLTVVWLLNGPSHGRGTALVEAILHRVPVLGRARRNLAVARLASALEALISAGVPILQAWELAGAACGSPALQGAIRRWGPLFENGVTPAEALQLSREFPEVFASLYHTGELTGGLDETLRRLRDLHQEQGARQMKALAEWTPKIVYFGIVLLIAWQIVQFWTGYFRNLGQF